MHEIISALRWRTFMAQNRPIESSTNEVQVSPFAAHGLIEIAMEGDILYYSATGPFNEELFDRFAIAQAAYLTKLQHPTPWVSIAIFVGCALFTPEAIASYTAAMKTPKPAGWAPVATAFVMGPDIEGSKIMAPHFRKIYDSIQRPFTIVDTLEEAKLWAQSMLDASHQGN
jgi:hypothetical protein